MFLKHPETNSMIEILDPDLLSDPTVATVPGRAHAGEELQDEAEYEKSELRFPSGEPLPRCWLDLHWRE
ncbi:MAG: acetyltransferase [Halothiobacillaceae bacterium]